jgi:hypothetical protein
MRPDPVTPSALDLPDTVPIDISWAAGGAGQ